MDMLEDIYAKRGRSNRFKDESPAPELIHELIYKTYKLVASKQNLMPYRIHVLGPDCKKYKEELYKLTVTAVPETFLEPRKTPKSLLHGF